LHGPDSILDFQLHICLTLLCGLTIIVCLLENKTILMFDWRVFKLSVLFAVTGAVVLNFDYDAPEFSVRKIQDIFDNRCVYAPPADIT